MLAVEQKEWYASGYGSLASEQSQHIIAQHPLTGTKRKIDWNNRRTSRQEITYTHANNVEDALRVQLYNQAKTAVQTLGKNAQEATQKTVGTSLQEYILDKFPISQLLDGINGSLALPCSTVLFFLLVAIA